MLHHLSGLPSKQALPFGIMADVKATGFEFIVAATAIRYRKVKEGRQSASNGVKDNQKIKEKRKKN